MSSLETLRARLPLRGRTLALLAAVIPLLALFVYVILRSGPWAPIAVTAVTVEDQAIAPGLFGIGTVQARHVFRIGPTSAGRLAQLTAEVGDTVNAGQQLGEMDPIDLEQRVLAQQSALQRAEALQREAQSRHRYAQAQRDRYEQLLPSHVVSEELVAAKRQELRIAEEGLDAARADLQRARAEREALQAQRNHLQLVAPVAGLVTARHVDPGTTVVAGQAVLEIIDPHSQWIDVRFDQGSAAGLAADLPAQIVLHSRAEQPIDAVVLRVEPLADAVTEEIRAKVEFAAKPARLPPIGELAEVSVMLPVLPASPSLPNAAVVRRDGQLGVWQISDDDTLRFAPIQLGAADLQGRVQVTAGLKAGDRVVLYSEKTLDAHSRVYLVEHIAGTTP